MIDQVKSDFLLDAAELCWFQHGDKGLGFALLKTSLIELGEKRGTKPPNVLHLVYDKEYGFGGTVSVVDAMFDRAVNDLHHLMRKQPRLVDYWSEMQCFPARFLMMQQGHGPNGRRSCDLDEARMWLVGMVGSDVGVEMLHGLVAGTIADRIELSQAERQTRVDLITRSRA